TNHYLSAGHALCHVVICLADQRHSQSINKKSAKALTRRAAKLYVYRAVGQALPRARKLTRKPARNRPIGIVDSVREEDSATPFRRRRDRAPTVAQNALVQIV